MRVLISVYLHSALNDLYLMERTYKCLPNSKYAIGDYALVSIRNEDQHPIMQWRNGQIDILRQKELLTADTQARYFKEVIDKLFEADRPSQVLFSFLHKDVLIGYGGFVHIDWNSGNAEVSFITEATRNADVSQFINDWKKYLEILKLINISHLGFNKIYTYAYDLRPRLYTALLDSGFQEEARLKNHVCIRETLYDVLIHSFFFKNLYFRCASRSDCTTYFNWVNDKTVRENSFHPNDITWGDHSAWFEKKIQSKESFLLIAFCDNKMVGQIRFDEIFDGEFEIDFSVDSKYRGNGFGSQMLLKGVEVLKFTKGNVKRVVGKVKIQNHSSAQSFVKAKFEQSTVEEKLLIFEKKLG